MYYSLVYLLSLKMFLGFYLCHQQFILLFFLCIPLGFPGDTVIKSLTASAGDAKDTGLTLGSRKSPRVGNGSPL